MCFILQLKIKSVFVLENFYVQHWSLIATDIDMCDAYGQQAVTHFVISGFDFMQVLSCSGCSSPLQVLVKFYLFRLLLKPGLHSASESQEVGSISPISSSGC